MSAYGKTQRHWRHIAKVNQDQSESSRTIRTQRLEQFTPSKLNGTYQQNSFAKSPAKNSLCKEGKFNSPRGTLLQPRQNLTLASYSSDGPQLLTYFMKSGNIQKKNSNVLENLKARNNGSHQNWSSLFEEMKKNYQQFKDQVMKQLKQYQDYINKQMIKVFQVLKNITELPNQEEKGLGNAKYQLSNFKICLESEQNLKKQTLKISKSAEILRFVPDKTQAKTKTKQIEMKFNSQMHSKIELIESKQTASFDKFFQIMQRLRDTIDSSTSPSKQSNLLKQRKNGNA